jgi:aryl-alcohol dehydrogenase-like predicted oxidoreductase
MRFRDLGDTGLIVSEITLGTVEIGLEYGFKGSAHYQKPNRSEALRLIRTALDSGINFIDTARAYGESESIIGQALQDISTKPILCSKVDLPNEAVTPNFQSLRHHVFQSLEESLRQLQLEAIDLLLIHNTTLNCLRNTDALACMEEARTQGKVRFIGASCYEEDASLAALESDSVRALQVPFNLLDGRMSRNVFPTASKRSAGVLVRSAYLRGVLTPVMNTLPEKLARLSERAREALTILGDEVRTVSEAALRYCLSFSEVSSVVIGVKTVEELRSNLTEAERGSLPREILEQLKFLGSKNDPLADTRNWQDLI